MTISLMKTTQTYPQNYNYFPKPNGKIFVPIVRFVLNFHPLETHTMYDATQKTSIISPKNAGVETSRKTQPLGMGDDN